MDYSTYTIGELIALKDEKEIAFETAKFEINEVADALREKLINQELENKFSQLSFLNSAGRNVFIFSIRQEKMFSF